LDRNQKIIEWIKGTLRVIDASGLPDKVRIIRLRSWTDVLSSMKGSRICGSGPLAIASAFAMVLASKSLRARNAREFFYALDVPMKEITSANSPFAVVAWALNRVRSAAEGSRHLGLKAIRGAMLNEAVKITEEESEKSSRIADAGSSLVRPGSQVLFFGNEPEILKRAHEHKRIKTVFIPDTGRLSRLSRFEMKRSGIPFALIPESSAGKILREKKVNRVIVGANTIASNGDVVADVGTYVLAVLAKEHGVPFYAASRLSSVNLSSASGDDVAGEGQPDHDVTPRQYVNALVTEAGLIKPPYREEIKSALRKMKHGPNDQGNN